MPVAELLAVLTAPGSAAALTACCRTIITQCRKAGKQLGTFQESIAKGGGVKAMVGIAKEDHGHGERLLGDAGDALLEVPARHGRQPGRVLTIRRFEMCTEVVRALFFADWKRFSERRFVLRRPCSRLSTT